jgi:hypothetical protein
MKLREGGLCCVEFVGRPEPGSGALTLLLDPDLYGDSLDTSGDTRM